MGNANTVENRVKAQNILTSEKSADAKLFEVFQIYKEDLHNNYSQLYYALLEWKDSHLKELLKETNFGVEENSYFKGDKNE